MGAASSAAMDITEHIAAIDRDSTLLADAAERAGLDAAVPTCPGWRVRDLVQHLGSLQRGAAWIVTTGCREQPGRAETEWIFAPVADERLLPWFREGHGALVDALRRADPTVECWQPLPAPSPLAYWARRQAHESAIHRVDAERAAGAPVATCDPAFAADGIDELLLFFDRPGGSLVADPPVTLAIRAVDAGRGWTIRIDAERRTVTADAEAGDCVVTGAASDLYLLLWNRRDADGLAVEGDPCVLELWRSKARIGLALP